MALYDIDGFPLRHYSMKGERSTSPFHISSQFYSHRHSEEKTLKTVSLSAICKEDVSHFTRSSSPISSPSFPWRQGYPEISPYDFATSRPDLSGTTSPLSSHAEYSLTEDGSSTLSPYITSTFEPTDYTNPNSFPSTPQESWINVEVGAYDGQDYQTLPYDNGSSSAILNVAPYPKPPYDLRMPITLPSQGLPLFADETATRSRKRKCSMSGTRNEKTGVVHQNQEVEDKDAGSDYAPRQRKKGKATRLPKATKTKQTRGRPLATRQATTYPSRKQNNEIEQYIAKKSSHGVIPCPHCQEQLHNKATLIRHIATLHTRLFACTFNFYGCNSTFGSKNEWKRHVATKHLRTAYWQCEMGRCAPSKPEERPKEFNRKDLFMQHVRRMHMPKHAKDKREADASIDNIARECYVHVRDPPTRSICGYCWVVGKHEEFTGPGSWEHRMEHVGKHLEMPGGAGSQCVVDEALEAWLIQEELIVDNGAGRLILRSVIDDAKPKN